MKKRIFSLSISLILCVAMITVNFASPVLGTGTLSGEGSRTVEELTYNGQSTGVVRTEIKLPSTSVYDLNVVNTIEFDLANTNLTLEAINNGTYLNTLTTVRNAANNFNAANDGKTVLAAVNGDLYMTAVHSNANVNTGGTFAIPRGVQIIDGEIWCSQEIDQEGLEATNNERGNPASPKYALGMTADYQPIVGVPKISIAIANTTKGTSTTADGLNRLPANNSLIIYNKRVANSRALKDALEIVIEVNTDEFRHGETITGKVVNVYPSGQGGTAAISGNHIVLTARGNRQSRISGYSVGDQITLTTTINSDKNQDMWRNCVSAICGHMPILIDGSPATSFDATRWPYTLVGYKDDGTVMITTNDGRQSNYSVGVKANQLVDFCKELGYNTVFWFDGGGSTTLVTYDDDADNCVVRNKPSDGSERGVANSLAVCWNDTPRGEQGSMDHVIVPASFNPYCIDFPNNMATSFGNTNNTSVSIQPGNVLRLTATAMGDPYVSFSFSNATKIMDATENKYIVLRLRTSPNARNGTFEIFFMTGTNTNGASAENSKSFTIDKDGQYRTYIFDMSDKAGWKGKLNTLRLDYFAFANVGDYVEISNMAFAKTKADAEALKANYDKGIYHMWDDGEITTAPSHSHDGVKTYTCLNCGETREEYIPALGGLLGDLNLDGVVNGQDSVLLLQAIASWDLPDNVNVDLGDVNGDNVLDGKDSVLMLQYLAGWFDDFSSVN